MASIANDPGGRKRLILNSNGTRKTIWLGKVSRQDANFFKVHAEKLHAACLMGEMPDDKTSRWLAALPDETHAKLVAVGLAPARQSTELGPFLDKYFEGLSLKPESIRKLKQTKVKLLAFFDPKKPLRAITPNEAADWRQSLTAAKLSEAAVKIHAGNAKTIFASAVLRGLLSVSPFQHLRSGCTRSAESRYITADEADAIVDALPEEGGWKLLFSLARHAGLRIPSESHLLTWADVDFDKARLKVRSPKTERWAGHESRQVPITPKLMKLLQDRFAAAKEGEERLVTMRGAGHMRRMIEAAIKRAEVAPWKKLFQSLRSSCEKEWAMQHPQFAVSKWMGHSLVVSGRHYANEVPDELFARASAPAVQPPAAATGLPVSAATVPPTVLPS